MKQLTPNCNPSRIDPTKLNTFMAVDWNEREDTCENFLYSLDGKGPKKTREEWITICNYMDASYEFKYEALGVTKESDYSYSILNDKDKKRWIIVKQDNEDYSLSIWPELFATGVYTFHDEIDNDDHPIKIEADENKITISILPNENGRYGYEYYLYEESMVGYLQDPSRVSYAYPSLELRDSDKGKGFGYFYPTSKMPCAEISQIQYIGHSTLRSREAIAGNGPEIFTPNEELMKLIRKYNIKIDGIS